LTALLRSHFLCKETQVRFKTHKNADYLGLLLELITISDKTRRKKMLLLQGNFFSFQNILLKHEKDHRCFTSHGSVFSHGRLNTRPINKFSIQLSRYSLLGLPFFNSRLVLSSTNDFYFFNVHNEYRMQFYK
jgi:hypothetical protein